MDPPHYGRVLESERKKFLKLVPGPQNDHAKYMPSRNPMPGLTGEGTGADCIGTKAFYVFAVPEGFENMIMQFIRER